MSASSPPCVHLQCLALDAGAIDASRHVDNDESLAWMETIAIAHSAAYGWSLERQVASATSWQVRSHAVDDLAPAFGGNRLVAAPGLSPQARS